MLDVCWMGKEGTIRHGRESRTKDEKGNLCPDHAIFRSTINTVKNSRTGRETLFCQRVTWTSEKRKQLERSIDLLKTSRSFASRSSYSVVIFTFFRGTWDDYFGALEELFRRILIEIILKLMLT